VEKRLLFDLWAAAFDHSAAAAATTTTVINKKLEEKSGASARRPDWHKFRLIGQV
jgi:hypothetical protein